MGYMALFGRHTFCESTVFSFVLLSSLRYATVPNQILTISDNAYFSRYICFLFQQRELSAVWRDGFYLIGGTGGRHSQPKLREDGCIV